MRTQVTFPPRRPRWRWALRQVLPRPHEVLMILAIAGLLYEILKPALWPLLNWLLP